jgi:hypothetical protein
MNRQQLAALLQRSGVSPTGYVIEGVHDDFWHDNSFFLISSAEGWAVGFYERGNRETYATFTDEGAACDYLADQFRRIGRLPATKDSV